MSNSSLMTKEVICRRSGLVLGSFQIYISEGYVAYAQRFEESLFLHPFYNLSPVVLHKKLNESLEYCTDTEVCNIPDDRKIRLQLLMSAVTHQLGRVDQDRAGLPPFQIAIGSAARLLVLSTWWHEKTTQRTVLPSLHIAKINDNLSWENFKYWLDACFEIREDWALRSRRMQHDAELRAADETVDLIRSELTRKIDISKVWNWVDLQLSQVKSIHLNERSRWRQLFLKGDLEVEQWVLDDIEDLIFAIVQHCDTENEIMYFIRKRVAGIKALLQDYYNSFTLIQTSTSALGSNDHLTPQEQSLFADLDQRLKSMGGMPPEPEIKDFATKGLFMQAKAKWNLLQARWESQQKVSGQQSPSPSNAPQDPQPKQDPYSDPDFDSELL